MQYRDRVTSGLESFLGQIGKELQSCEQQQIAEFKPISLFDRSPGKLSHAKWLTVANRILRLYISKTSPSNNLLILVNYIAKAYIPMWFNIKNKTSITEEGK